METLLANQKDFEDRLDALTRLAANLRLMFGELKDRFDDAAAAAGMAKNSGGDEHASSFPAAAEFEEIKSKVSTIDVSLKALRQSVRSLKKEVRDDEQQQQQQQQQPSATDEEA